MPYVTLAALRAALPAEISDQLLDDESSGAPNPLAWPSILAAVTAEIDGKIGQRYPLPLVEPVPALITNAAFTLAAELVYQRRGYFGLQNPWTDRASGIRGTMGQKGGQSGLLDKIADGSLPLTPTLNRAQPSVSVISAPARTASSRLSA